MSSIPRFPKLWRIVFRVIPVRRVISSMFIIPPSAAIAEENKALRLEGQKEFDKAKKETELYISQKQEEAEAIVKAAEEKGQEKLIEAEEQLAELNGQILETKNAAKELIGRLGELMKLGI